MDINFNKHYNHGIEIRFFDHILCPNLIKESFEFIIYLVDLMFESNVKLNNPIKTKLWNNLVCNVMKNGKKYNMTSDEITCFEQILNIKVKSVNINDFYYEVFSKLKTKFSMGFNGNLISIGKFSRHVLMPNKIVVKYPNEIELNSMDFNINEIINISKFSEEFEIITNYVNIPNELLNIVEVVDTLGEIQEQLKQLNQLNKLDTNKSTNSKNNIINMVKDINQILQKSIDVLNYNIEKMLENKNKIETELFVKIINLIGCFKII